MSILQACSLYTRKDFTSCEIRSIDSIFSNLEHTQEYGGYYDIIVCNVEIQYPLADALKNPSTFICNMSLISCYFLDKYKNIYICTVSKDSSYI
jgi:hypothetical protein